MEHRIIYTEETTSTNTFIKDIIAGEPETENLTLVYTGFQTAGRGQRGNTWESEKGKNLTFSVLIKPKGLPANEQFLISEISSLAVRDLLMRHCTDIRIKWPNDVYWKDKKICGMLIENSIDSSGLSYSISGIGININQEVFVSNAPNPISLKNITGKDYVLQDMIAEFMDIIGKWFDKLTADPAGIHREYLSSVFRIDIESSFRDKDGEFRGTIVDVEPHGLLVIRDTEGKTRKYGFKEIAYII